MEQNPSWDANSNKVSHELPRLLWKPKLNYRIHKNPSLAPILSQMNPVHNFSPHLPKIHSNTILPSTPRSSEWSLVSRFSGHNSYAFFISPILATFPPISCHYDANQEEIHGYKLDYTGFGYGAVAGSLNYGDVHWCSITAWRITSI